MYIRIHFDALFSVIAAATVGKHLFLQQKKRDSFRFLYNLLDIKF